MRLAEDRFYNNYPCIIVTAKGQPDVATRLFLRKLKQTLKIPVLGLVDSDPYGLKILSVYMKVWLCADAPACPRTPPPPPPARRGSLTSRWLSAPFLRQGVPGVHADLGDCIDRFRGP